ncbi:T9SS type A sorting domain-containing protein [Hyphobacterium sp. CCMP332]|nr:T9SS type A sorting domain-containing protein [Hyphobacterium sp. CCMP332]
MKRFYLLLSILTFSVLSAFSQPFPLLTIQQVQQVPNDSLGTTTTGDLSPYNGDTVTIRGVVVTPPGVGVSSSTQGRWIWIQDGNGPWSGINVRYSNSQSVGATTPDDMLNVVPGDSVEITGVISEFLNETQIDPLPSGGFAILTGVSGLRPVLTNKYSDLSVFQLSNPAIPSSVSGEPLEASFAEFIGVEVTNVVATSTDIRFTVKDANNNEVEVYDTYTVQQPSVVSGNNQIPYPPFNPPVIGDIFDTLKGIIDGRNFGNSPPYAIAPFDTTHYVYGPSAPKITNVFRNIQVPTDADQVTVTATIADNGGSIVGVPQLFYAFGEANTNFTPVSMTFTGSNNLYTAIIPAASDGQMVKYYLQATDNDNNTTSVPSAGANDKKFFYFVRNTGLLTVRDLQYTIYNDGESGYLGETVTVQGVVSASIADGDFESFNWIQDVNVTEWGGIRVAFGGGNPQNFSNTPKGELVQVTGIVQESFGFTQIEVQDDADFTTVTTVGAPAPIEKDPGDFTSYSLANEKYEGLLLKFVGTNPGDSVYIVEDNADAPSDFGEFRVGLDKFNPNNGSRVLVGRGGGSINVSFTTPNVQLDPNYSITQIPVEVGDRMTGLTGVMYYSFGNFKLLPRSNSDFENNSITRIDRNEVADRTLKIYPNPSSDELSLVSAFDNKSYQVEIYNTLGQKVWENQANGKLSKFNLRMMQNGQYIMKVMEEGNFIESFQLIINR